MWPKILNCFHKKNAYNNSFRTILFVRDMTLCSRLQECSEEFQITFCTLHSSLDYIYKLRSTYFKVRRPLLQFFIDLIRTLLSHITWSIIVKIQTIYNLIGQKSVHTSDFFKKKNSMNCIAHRGRENSYNSSIIHFGNEIFEKVRKILNHQRS